MGLFSFLSPSSSASTSSTSTTTSNSESLSANSGTGGVYQGATINLTDAGIASNALSSNSNVVDTALQANNAATLSALDAGTNNLANLINFANNTLLSSNDIVSKSLGLAAATSGSNAQIVGSLTAPTQSQTPATGTVDYKTYAFIAAAAGAAYYFMHHHKG